MKKAIVISMAVLLAAFACAQTTTPKPAAKSGAKSTGYQWAVSSGGAWKWVNAPLSAEEQSSLD